jgi:hypothetical protein
VKLFGFNPSKLFVCLSIVASLVLLLIATSDGYWRLVALEYNERQHGAAVGRALDKANLTWNQFQTQEREKCEARRPQCLIDERASWSAGSLMFFSSACDCPFTFYPQTYQDLRFFDGVVGINHRLIEMLIALVGVLTTSAFAIFALPILGLRLFRWLKK